MMYTYEMERKAIIGILIIIAVAIVFALFKYFDREFIKVTHFYKDSYYLRFENENMPLCILLDKCEYKNSLYYVFIPTEVIDGSNPISPEDVIVLKKLKNKADEIICVYPTIEVPTTHLIK